MGSTPSESLAQMLGKALRAFQGGDLRAADALIHEAIRLHPDSAEPLAALAMLRLAQGRELNAIESFEKALSLDPQNADLLGRATTLCLQLRRGTQAEELASRLVQVQPTHAHARFLLSNAVGMQGSGLEAVEHLRAAVDMQPENPLYHHALGQILGKLGMTGRAIGSYRRSLAIRPNPRAAVELAELLMIESNFESAVELLEENFPMLEEPARPYALLARAYTEARQFEKAEPAWQLALKSGDARSVRQTRIDAEVLAGRLEVAESLIRDELKRNPDLAHLYRILTTIKKMGPEDAELIAQAEGLLAKEGIPVDQFTDLAFSLAKSFHDLAQFDNATHFYDEANRARFESSSYLRGFDRQAFRSSIDAQIQFFSRERIAELCKRGIASDRPIFVVGMIRSGTTLVEQILSRHSEIASGGEKSFWEGFAREVMPLETDEFDSLAAKRLGEEYLSLLSDEHPDSLRVIDKNPDNLTIVGMLHCIFPFAKFVHVVRNPVDNLLSIWMTPMAIAGPFFCDRDNLVFAYRERARLARHWISVIPPTRFFTVRYEDLTGNPRSTIDELLEFLEVAKERDCYHPEANPRTVRTPSVYQVRQAINTASQAKWKAYGPWLGAFAQLLDDPTPVI